MHWKRYNKDAPYSYTLGPFPTMELIDQRADLVEEILISPEFRQKEELIRRLEEKGLPYRLGDKEVDRLAHKGNTYVIGIFRKETSPVYGGNHVVLHEISDMGNLGNICRTMLAMDCRDLVTIGNCCDYHDPRTVRASMGALFYLRHEHFACMEDYLQAFGSGRKLYLFMLSEKAETLPRLAVEEPWSLVFGNEGRGLPPEMARFGKGVMIPQSEDVDSLNLTTAVAIGLYQVQNFLKKETKE